MVIYYYIADLLTQAPYRIKEPLIHKYRTRGLRRQFLADCGPILPGVDYPFSWEVDRFVFDHLVDDVSGDLN